MSQITSIYNAIEGLSVAAGGSIPACDDLDEIRDSYEDAHLPRRILLPWYGRNARSSFAFIADGVAGAIDWTIIDLMLYRRAGMGIGIKDSASALVSYAAAYAEALRSIRGVVTTVPQSEMVEAPQIEVGVFAYPDAAGAPMYEGVKVTLRVREYLTQAP